jgi:hypothetical protein
VILTLLANYIAAHPRAVKSLDAVVWFCLATPSRLPGVRAFAAVFYGGLAAACAMVGWWPGVAAMAGLWLFTVLCLRLVPVAVRRLERDLAQWAAEDGGAP